MSAVYAKQLATAIASKLNIGHIGNSSHKLSLDIEKIVRIDASLRHFIESVHKTMSACEKTQNRPILQDISSSTPILESKIR